MRRIAAAFVALLLLGSDLAFARTVRYLPPQTLEVCSSGCAYTTIGSALAAISDASPTKPYLILPAPGDYPEALTWKSYVTMECEDRNTTRIGCATGAGCDSITLTQDITNASFFNCAIVGSQPFKYASGGTPAASIVQIRNCYIGTNDTSWNSVASRDGILTVATGAPRSTYSQGNIYRSAFDTIRISDGDFLYSKGDQFELIVASAIGLTPRVLSTISGGFILMSDFRVQITDSLGTSGSAFVNFLDYSGSGTTSNLTRVQFSGGDIRIDGTNGSRNSPARCFYFRSAATSVTPVQAFITNVNCTIVSASASSTNAAVEVDSDGDHANWVILRQGGKDDLQGAANRWDLDNADTTANAGCSGSGTPYSCCTGSGTGTCGFRVTIDGVVQAGNYTGAGIGTITTLLKDVHLPTDVIRNSCLATAPATCSIGDSYCDTSGANCFCTAANTWTNMTGVGACV